jgi:MOSC domain-containing protein YiiM
MSSNRPRLAAVNVGPARDGAWAGRLRRTAIDKRPVAGPVGVRALGVEGDVIVDTKFHGGIYKAVYAFAREDLDAWGEQLGDRLPPGFFGENLTTAGIDVNEALVGERWRIGTTLLEVVDVRIPCRVFANWVDHRGLDATGWIKRFSAVGRPGPYLRVLEEGTVEAGDEIVVAHRPAHHVTVTAMFRALTTDRSLLPSLLSIDCLPPDTRARAERWVDAMRPDAGKPTLK